MKHHCLLLLALTVLTVLPASADPISPRRAVAIAREFAGEQAAASKGLGGSHAAEPMAVAYTATATAGDNAAGLLYVVNRGSRGGFVVVAGDDAVANPVLGYSDRGSFSYERAPDNLKWWIGEYARQIEYMVARGITSAPAPTFDRNAGPLVTTQWNQGDPYNRLCPTIDGERVWAGCVATAMAQLMNYYEWPKQGAGSHSYQWNGQTLSADFGSTTYDWVSMADIYDGSNSQAEVDAVATLTYHCGVATEMNYGLDASGASEFNIINALVNYFGYAPDATLKMRDYYSYGEWLSMLKTEIDADRPVLYVGQSTGGGHAFLLDGYDTDGYFHVNWGWGGMSDGYYQVATLNPYEGQGAGAGSDSGFAYTQRALFNLHVPEDGVEYEPENLLYIDQLLFALPDEVGQYYVSYEATVSKTDKMGFVFQGCYNFGEQVFDGYVGVCIEDDKGEVVDCYTSKVEIPSRYGWTNTLRVSGITMQGYADGHYRVYPCYMVEGDDAPMHIPSRKLGSGYVDITVDGDEVALSTQASTFSSVIKSDILILDNDELNANEDVTVLVNLTNTGTEYYNSNVNLMLIDENGYIAYPTDQGYYYAPSYVSVAPGATATVMFTQRLTGFTGDEDIYYMALQDTNLGSLDPAYTPININNPDIVAPEYPTIGGSLGNMTMSIKLDNPSSTDYVGTVGALVLDGEDAQFHKMLDAKQVELAAGSSATVTLQGSMADLAPGLYMIYLYGNSQELGYLTYEITQPVPSIAGNVEITNEDPANLALTATFKNSKGDIDYTGDISARIYKPGIATGEYTFIKVLDTHALAIPAGGRSQAVTFSGSFTEGEPGGNYQIRLYDDETEALLGSIEYTMPNTSGVDKAFGAAVGVYPNPVGQLLNVTAATAIDRVAIYSTDGKQVGAYNGDGSAMMQIDMGGLSRGIYFVRIFTGTGTETVKIIRN